MMDVEPTSSNTLLKGAIGVLLSVLTWVWLRIVGQQDRHDKRLSEIERTMATKGDITAVFERVTELTDQSARHHVEVLRTIYDLKDRR